MEYSNYEVIVQSGHVLCFELFESASSLKELAEIQLNVLEAISKQDANLEKFETIGKNLYNFSP